MRCRTTDSRRRGQGGSPGEPSSGCRRAGTLASGCSGAGRYQESSPGRPREGMCEPCYRGPPHSLLRRRSPRSREPSMRGPAGCLLMSWRTRTRHSCVAGGIRAPRHGLRRGNQRRGCAWLQRCYSACRSARVEPGAVETMPRRMMSWTVRRGAATKPMARLSPRLCHAQNGGRPIAEC